MCFEPRVLIEVVSPPMRKVQFQFLPKKFELLPKEFHSAQPGPLRTEFSFGNRDLPFEAVEQEAGKRGDSGPAGANRMLSGNGHIISKADIGWRSGIGRRGTFRLISGNWAGNWAIAGWSTIGRRIARSVWK